jgi:TRAP-type C4-dicarboxylate transport system permease small subunit
LDETRIGKAVGWLATAIAIAGGSVLVLVTIITVFSVIGRALIPLGLGPIRGDFEIIQTGVMFAIFCALPITQYHRGHADVSVITDYFPARAAAIIELVMDALMVVVTIFILWRFSIGLLDKYGNREMTFILHTPVWWSYAVGLLGAVCTVIVAIYCLARSTANALSKNPVKPEPGIF